MSRIGDWFAGIAEQAGLDPCEERTVDAVSAAVETIARVRPEWSAADVADFAVDALIDASGHSAGIPSPEQSKLSALRIMVDEAVAV